MMHDFFIILENQWTSHCQQVLVFYYNDSMTLRLDPAAIEQALTTDVTAQRIMAKTSFPQIGEHVGVRLNLNVLKSTGIAVQTIHAASNKNGYKRNQGFYNGEAIGYAGAVALKNAYFNVHQGARELIAMGLEAKSPMASVDGQFDGCPNCIDDAAADATIRFNPKDMHLFVDEECRAIRRAEYAIVVGHRVYAFGEIELHTDKTAPAREGTYPSIATIEGQDIPNVLKTTMS